jgi:hypothetical protein
MSVQPLAVSFRGSLIKECYDLRVARRCLVEDLALDDEAWFGDFAELPIGQRLMGFSPDDRQVSAPVPQLPDVRRLDHSVPEAAVWVDEERNIAWLVAVAGEDRSIEEYGRSLASESRLMPDPADIHRADSDRLASLLYEARVQAPYLLKRARRKPGPHRMLLGIRPTIDVIVEYHASTSMTVVRLPKDLPHLPPVRDGRLRAALLVAFHASGEWLRMDQPDEGFPEYRSYHHQPISRSE